MASKRRLDGGDASMAIVPHTKKQKQNQIALSDKGNALQALPQRTSALQAPIMLLTGQEGEICSARFHPSGETLASVGFDRLVYLWNVYDECDNFAVLKGHSGAIMDVHFSTDGDTIFTASTDKTLAMWDYETGSRIKKLKGHTSFVNSCCPSRRGMQYIVSGSDDCTIKLWDTRKRGCVQTFQNAYQVTAVAFSDTSDQIFSGGIDDQIKVWDLRKNDILYTMSGHTDTVSGLRLSPDGSFLLSNSMDNTVRMWDVRAFAPMERCLKVFLGAQHSFEKNLIKCGWSPDGLMIASGSADRCVYVWDTNSRRILYKLPGHNGSVNDVDFHPTEPILLSCGSDKKIYLGELQG
ncbi:U5 small nuclear ribonucleoprotein 40 kDa protein-like [Actinia tenebrosa]|uniref:U5 small nuclear ribonucleoprotein 40 kDa protein n=1 Tax=Actinia tenebrosa TaxID=6105 RepID=A0A6P8IN37_ACTTE|nr:U5 small nuclear ribonucleoprotein 40 kDa protein-like [Actinia tenebrosa]